MTADGPSGLCAVCGRSRYADRHVLLGLNYHAFEAMPHVADTGAEQAPTMSPWSLCENWRPGSFDPPWLWEDEMNHLADTDADHTRDLMADIASHGILVPVELGHDGRVWEGHHRVCIAIMLNLPEIPFHFNPEPADEGMPPGRPGFWHNVVGHPLLYLWPKMGERIHDRSRPWIDAKPKPS